MVLDPDEDSTSIISMKCHPAATQAGCDDPMIHYLYIRFGMDQTTGKETFANEFCQTARAMDNSSYPYVRKFYAAFRGMDQLYYAYGADVFKQIDWGDMANLM